MRKINIHLTLDERGLAYCYEVNSRIRAITESVIEFGPGSPMIPHISLIMGQLRDDELRNISEITASAVGGEAPLAFFVDAPYLEDVRTRYIFSDVRDGDNFMRMKRKLHSSLDGKYLDVQTDYTEVAHLTLGHVENRKDEVRKYLGGVTAGFSIYSPAVEISDAGPKGTCINSLYKFLLK